MLSIGFLYAFGATLSWAIGAFPLTRAARLIPVNSMNHLRLLPGVLLVAIIAAVVEQERFFSVFSSPYMNGWIWLGVSGILALVIGDFFSFRSYAILSPQYGSVLGTLSPTSALLAGIVLLNEQINLIGIIGMLITIFGVISISLGRSERNRIPDHGHGSVVWGIVLGVMASLCHGTALAFSKKGFLEQAESGHLVGPITGGFMRLLAGMLVLFLITIMSGRTKKVVHDITTNKKGLRLTLLGSLFNPSFAVSLSMISILYMDVAVAQTIFSLVPLFAVIIAFVFYKEKITRRSVYGIIAALVGVFLLVWRNRIGAFIF
ncbi:MAG TPA: DMT family transporter [Chitinophagaceae bacterium]